MKTFKGPQINSIVQGVCPAKCRQHKNVNWKSEGLHSIFVIDKGKQIKQI